LRLRSTLATNVRIHRLRLGLTQEAFAERCGLHRTYVGSIERCGTNLRLSSLEALAQAIGVRAADLLAPGMRL
jgi:transcriptional regulator with XRE-family HTH domain